MDLQTYFDNAVAASRKKSFDESDQLTLGELILKLEAIAEKKRDGEEPHVVFDFGSTYPTGLISWRGSYNELALTWTGGDYADKYEEMTLSAFLKLLKESVGKVFEGWKGGDFTMTKNTPVWVSNSGMVSHSAVIEVVDDSYQVILITGYSKY